MCPPCTVFIRLRSRHLRYSPFTIHFSLFTKQNNRICTQAADSRPYEGRRKCLPWADRVVRPYSDSSFRVRRARRPCRAAFSFVCAADTSVIHRSLFTVHCSQLLTKGGQGRLRAPPVADTARNKEWQRSSGDPTQPSKAGALGRGRATKCAHVRRKAPNGAKWSLRGREAAVSAAHKFRAPQQKSSAPTGAALYLLSAMVKVNSVRPSRLVT